MVRMILFGGKGGVGKTTTAAAVALHSALKGFKTLIVSSDPAHSTCDSFEQKIGDKPTPIRGVENLWAVEVDTQRAMREVVKEMAGNTKNNAGAWLMGMDNLTEEEILFPGMDELCAFEVMLHYIENKYYDLIIFDTAPTGHTLRFLSLPDLMDSWFARMEKMHNRVGIVKSMMGKGNSVTREKEQMKKIRTRINKVRTILSDPEQTAFYIVLIPEMLALEESRKAKRTLQEYNIPVQGAVVNFVLPLKERCKTCDACICADRYRIQQKYLRAIKSEFVSKTVARIPLFRYEVKGLIALGQVGAVVVPQLKLKLTRNLVKRNLISPQHMVKLVGKPINQPSA